jgi:BASS family bile acid:Na+ symporter
MNILRNSSLLLLIFVVLAFIFPKPAVSMKFLLIPVLIISMTLSLQGTSIGRLRKENRSTVLWLIASNFILLSGFFILSSFFISDPEFRQGIIVLAAVPPAIAVITAAFLLKTDTEKALLAEAACYLLGLVLTPAIIWIFFRSQVNIWELVKILLMLIFLPFILAKGLDWLKKKLGIKYDFKEVANIVFGLTFYMSLALAVDRILASLSEVVVLIIIAVLSTFGLGLLVIFLGKKFGVSKKDLALFPLFATLKNGSMALGICISLFQAGSYVPVAVRTVADALYLVFFFWIFKKI